MKRFYFDITYWTWNWPERGETGWYWSIGPFLYYSRDYSDRYSN